MPYQAVALKEQCKLSCRENIRICVAPTSIVIWLVAMEILVVARVLLAACFFVLGGGKAF